MMMMMMILMFKIMMMMMMIIMVMMMMPGYPCCPVFFLMQCAGKSSEGSLHRLHRSAKNKTLGK